MNGKKISTHLVASALVIIIVWCVRTFAKIEIPAEVGVALGTVLAVIISAVVPDSMEADDDKQAGFVRPEYYPWLIVIATGAALVMLYGCMGPQAALPKTIPEQVEAANLLVDKLSDGIVDMTCTQFKKGQCVEPGKPLMPDDAIKSHASVARAHAALMVTGTIPLNGVGECMGKQRTQAACLAAASALLTEVDRMLIAKKGVQ